MNAPRLTHEFVLEQPTQNPDGGGGYQTIWTPLGTLWGALDPRSGGERFSGGRETSTITHRITVRNAPIGSPQRPQPAQRLRRGDRVFAIRGVTEEDGEAVYLRLFCEEGPFQ
ncbi:MAG: phage head closure protein [Pseudomonadota bacterium]